MNMGREQQTPSAGLSPTPPRAVIQVAQPGAAFMPNYKASTASDTPMLDTVDAQTRSPEEALGIAVMERAMEWGVLFPIAELQSKRLTECSLNARLALEGCRGHDLESAQRQFKAVLDELGVFSQERVSERLELTEQGADVGFLDKMYDEVLTSIIQQAAGPEVGQHWLLWRYVGNSVHEMQGMRGGAGYPAPDGNISLHLYKWGEFVDGWVAEWKPMLDEALHVSFDAGELDADPDLLDASIALYGDMAVVREATGRRRELLQAVAVDAAPAGWDHWLLMNSDQLYAQISAEDITRSTNEGWDADDIDFTELDDAVDVIIEEEKKISSNDDVTMKALKLASTPAEREYILRRLDQRGKYNDVYEELNGADVDDFDAYREKALRYGRDDHAAKESYGVGDAVLDGLSMAPGAIAGTGYGMIESLPIVGDMIEKEYGADARGVINGIHHGMGVSEEMASQSTAISIAGGKVAGAVGGMAAGGALSNGLKGARALSNMGKIKTFGAGVFTAADLYNNGHQAVTGEKVTGDEISGMERGAAGVGLVGGLADVVGMGAKFASGAGDGAKVMSGPSDMGKISMDDILDPNFGAGKSGMFNRLAPSEAVQTATDGFVTGTGLASQGMKVADAGMKMAGSKDSVTSMSDTEITEEVAGWLASNSKSDKAPQVQAALESNDQQRLRAFVTVLHENSDGGGGVEQGVGMAAAIASIFAG
ncbi:MAG: hypothetical protein ACI9MC_001795 [Kiritimatiellia bacterium]|jgi:hypothetical protein